MVGMRFTSEYLQVLGDRRFNFGIARKRAAACNAKSLGRLLFRQPVVANTVVDDDAGGFLRDDLARSFGPVVSLSAHTFRKVSLRLRPAHLRHPAAHRYRMRH